MKRLALAALVTYVLALASGARAQEPRLPGAEDLRFTRLSVEEGLSHSVVREVFQDRKGFLWFGTNNGLNKYDGYRLTVFRNEPGVTNSLPGNTVTSLAETSGAAGALLWIGTTEGLASFDNARQQFVRYYSDPANASTLSSNDVQALHVDRQGALWVGTREGLNRFDPATGAIVRFVHRATDSRTLTSGMVTSLAEAPDGGIWVGTEGGLSRLDVASGWFTRFTHDLLDGNTIAENRVRSLLVDTRGRVWVGTDTRGLDVYDARVNRFIHYPRESGLSNVSVNAILEDAEGQVWVGVWGGGVNRVIEDPATGRLTFVPYRHDPANPSTLGVDDVNVLAQDRSGVIWVGTYGVGLSWFKPAGRIRLTQYRYSPSDVRTLSDDRVHALLVDRTGTTWIATWAGLNVLRPGTTVFERLPVDGYLSDRRMTSLAEGPDGTIWGGTLDGGVNRIDPRTMAIQHVRAGEFGSGLGLSSDRVTALAMDLAGRVWIGTLNAGLNRFDPSTGEIARYRSNGADAATPSSDRIQSIMADAQGRIWVGSSEGLDMLDPSTGALRRISSVNGAPPALGGAVNTIHEFPDGLMWVGTATGGLVRFQAAPDGTISEFRSFTHENGLSSDVIVRVLHDERGFLWLATADGLNRFDPRTGAVLFFDESDGLRSEEFYSGVHDASGSGRMLLGGPRGLITFRPSLVHPNAYAPPVALTGFTILNRPVPIGPESPLKVHISEATEITLSHRDTVFSFEFAAFNFGASDRVQYAYRLEGFDPEWNYTDASRRSTTYTNLNPGQYTFEVRASNRDGVWTQQPLRVSVVILPPYWATWWFQVLVAAGVVALALGAHRMRVGVVERQRQQLATLVETRTAELKAQTDKSAEARAAAERANADKSRFLANITHEIRTPLNAVVGLSDALGGTRLNPQQQEYARALRSAGEALSEIIADILDVSKIEADRFELARAAFELRRLVEEAADVARVSAVNKGLTLEIEVAAEVPGVVLGDHRALRRILLNLLSNAVKFTDAGAVSLHVASGPEPSAIVFIVTDTGIGIQPSEQQRIFESFVQADASISSKYGGTGLGLAISRRLVELMGGRLWLESVPGRGSTFSFSVPLPMVAPSAIAATPGAGASDVTGPPLRILIVDDAEQNRMVMRAYFQHTPHSVTMAEHGEEGLELFASSKYDLVLMDVHMPGMDGYAATRAMRKWEQANRRERTPIVAVTANAFADDVEKSLAAGCDGHLTKPIRKPVLFEAIDRYARGIGDPAGPAGREARANARAEPSARPAAPVFMHADSADAGPIAVTVATEVAPYIPGYLTVTREQLAAGVRSLDAGDCLPLRTLGHNLKGSGASFGLDEISRMGWRLERTAARGEVGLAREAAHALTAYLERLVVT